MYLKEPSFIKDVNEILDENPNILDEIADNDDLPEVDREEEFFESTFREAKYFDSADIVDAIKNNADDIQKDYEYIISAYFKKDFNSTASALTLDGDDVTSSNDAIKYADEMINESFGESNDDLKLETKGIFLIYASGLDSKSSNIFGLYSCLISAIRRVGEKAGVVSVESLCRALKKDASDNSMTVEAIGSLSKCKFLGKPFDINNTDTFARANDSNYISRVNANIRDDSKVNNRTHQYKTNVYNRIYKDAFEKVSAFAKERMDRDIRRNDTLPADDPKKTTSSAIEKAWNKKTRLAAIKKAKEGFDEWLKTGELEQVIDEMNKDIESEKNIQDVADIDFF